MQRILFVGLVLGLSVSSSTAAESDLQRARELLSRPNPSGAIGEVKLEGFRFSRELEVGNGIRVIAIAAQFGGGLIAYGPHGNVIAAATTHEITWLQLFDLDEDGQSEVITEEVDGRGTGVLIKSFTVYGIRAKKVEKLWNGESYFRSTLDERPKAEEERVGLIRFFPSGGGHETSRLVHVERIDGQWRESVYEMREGHVTRATSPRQSSVHPSLSPSKENVAQ